jgi:predicted O-methyltransferase YrrM
MPRGMLTDPALYNFYQYKGLHILPVHFYSSLPNTSELKQTMWDAPSQLMGVDQNIAEQIQFLKLSRTGGWLDEYHELPVDSGSPAQYSRGFGFGEADGAILYSMIRHHRPKRMIEIGAGASTLLSSIALKRNNREYQLTAVDPYPPNYLLDRSDITVIQKKVEDLSFELFDDLDAGDILFINSSHTVRIGGDVLHEILDILPRLKKGVIIHIHDIFLPYHYPKSWIMDQHSSWTEQYLVQAFLSFNSAFKVLWGFCMASHAEPALVSELYSTDLPLDGGSLWIEKVT